MYSRFIYALLKYYPPYVNIRAVFSSCRFSI